MTAPVDPQKQAEAQARYDALTRRIAALDHDIALETDGENMALLEARRADTIAKREAVYQEAGGLVRATDDRGWEPRVSKLETDVARIKRHLRPPWQVIFWRGLSIVAAVLSGAMLVAPGTKPLFELFPEFAIAVTVFLVGASIVLWRMGAVTLERIE